MTLPVARDAGQATVVLVGAGHAHLHVLQHAHMLQRAGIRTVLVAPSRFDYSGLATGVLSGALPPNENCLDITRLAAVQNVEHHVGEVREIDLHGRTVRTSDGTVVAFDLLSLNVGSVVADPSGLAPQIGVLPVKPLHRLSELRLQVEAAASTSGECPTIVVAGGGPSALEVSAAIAGLCERLQIAPSITVVGSPIVAEWAPRSALRAVVRRLKARGVQFRHGVVVGRTTGSCTLENDGHLPCDLIVLATGLRGAALTAESGLPVNDHGRLRVTNQLLSIGDERVFAVGDCSVIVGDERPALGVFGVRAAPILLDNIVAAARGGVLSSYRPQRRWLSVLDLGDGTGLAVRGGFWWLGRSPLWLKRWLDRGFLARHRVA